MNPRRFLPMAAIAVLAASLWAETPQYPEPETPAKDTATTKPTPLQSPLLEKPADAGARSLPSDVPRRPEFERLFSRYQIIEYSFDEKGVLFSLRGNFGSKEAGRTNRELAYQFLEENKAIWGITDPRTEFRVDGNPESPAFNFQQYHDGVAVMSGNASINFDSYGTLRSIILYYSPLPKLSGKPGITMEQARVSVASRLKQPVNGCRFVNEELYFAHYENVPTLVYSGLALCESAGSWRYQVDARTGIVIVIQEAIRHAQPSTVNSDTAIPAMRTSDDTSR